MAIKTMPGVLVCIPNSCVLAMLWVRLTSCSGDKHGLVCVPSEAEQHMTNSEPEEQKAQLLLLTSGLRALGSSGGSLGGHFPARPCHRRTWPGKGGGQARSSEAR